MNIYTRIVDRNPGNLHKAALSMVMDDGSCNSYTYAAMFSGIELFAQQLLRSGLVAGDRLAIVSENCPEWIIAYLAAMKIHATAVLVDASLTPDEIEHFISKSDVAMILTSPKLLSKIKTDAMPSMPLQNIQNSCLPFDGHPGSVDPERRPFSDCDATIANIIFSSGTTRTAAGIMHTHEAMLNSTQMCLDQINMHDDERFLGLLPCSHIYGVVCTMIGPLLIGAEVRFLQSLTSDAILATFASYKPSIFPAVPKMLELFRTQIMRKIQSDPKTDGLFKTFFPICYSMRKNFGINLGKVLFKSVHEGFGGALDIICSAGAPLDKETADFYYGCGLTVLITYGATETNIPTLGNLRHELTTDSCGKAYPDVNVKIGASGELLIQSPYMMKGYFRDTDATAQAFQDGWFSTGDLGTIDEKGRYTITGRVKDNIVLATGKKVTPDDVEAQYGVIEGVKELVVCGIPPVAGAGDEIHAFIVLNDEGNRDAVAKAVQDIGAQLSSTMKITALHFVDAIPRTSLQKPKRYLLKQSVAVDTSALPEIAAKPRNTEAVVTELIAKITKTDPALLNRNSRPFAQLGIDSLSAIDMALQIESEFHVAIDEVLAADMTIGDLVDRINMLQAEGQEGRMAAENASRLYPAEKDSRDYWLFSRFRSWARMLYKITIKGEEMLPSDSGYIVCANHLSNFDYLWLSMNFEKERFAKFCCMAKKELVTSSRFSKRFSKMFGMIPVDRGNINVGLMQCCKEMLSKKWGLLIYPEGTRSNDGSLGTLKDGAAQLAIESNVPIIPVMIDGAYEIYPKGKRLPHFFNFRKMSKYPVKVSYGEPIYPRDLTVAQLTQLVETAMKSLCAA